jgi:alpha-L-rhamnosidase
VGYYQEAAGQVFTQTINVLALAFNIVPDSQRAALETKLINDIMVARSGHEEVGIVGARWILPVLSQAAADGVAGAAQAAYTIATQTTYPSYGYWNSLGWTGLGEIWESTARTHSHHMFGSIAQWFYQNLAGIQALKPGYQEIAFEPTIPDGLDHASASYDSVRGTITSSWQTSGSTLHLDVTVPPNATGLVLIPAPGPGSVTATVDNGLAGDNISFAGHQGALLRYRISSGSYHFTVSGYTKGA